MANAAHRVKPAENRKGENDAQIRVWVGQVELGFTPSAGRFQVKWTFCQRRIALALVQKMSGVFLVSTQERRVGKGSEPEKVLLLE